jgi:hypothetical protein
MTMKRGKLPAATCRTVFWWSVGIVSMAIFVVAGTVLASVVAAAASRGGEYPPSLPSTLQALRYNEVAYATTHNSFAVFGELAAGNQFRSVAESLEQGVRALMLDAHFTDATKSAVALCHGDCSYGTVNLAQVLETIAAFLDRHPQNVITIIWETKCSPTPDCAVLKGLLYTAFEQSRLADVLYAPANRGDPWPTLYEMIQTRQQIVQFFDNAPFVRPWDLEMWDNVIETPYSNTDKSDLEKACAFHRGEPDRPDKLFLNNHFTLRGLVPLPLATAGYNTNPFMFNRVTRCQRELGKPITNFIAVDHWGYSEVVETAACLNGEGNAATCAGKDAMQILRVAAVTLLGVCGSLAVVAVGVLLYNRLVSRKARVAPLPAPVDAEDAQPLLNGEARQAPGHPPPRG